MTRLGTSLLFALIFWGCQKEFPDSFSRSPQVTADSLTIADSSFILHGTVIDLGDGVVEHGHFWCSPDEMFPIEKYNNSTWCVASTKLGPKYELGPFSSQVPRDLVFGHPDEDGRYSFYSYAIEEDDREHPTISEYSFSGNWVSFLVHTIGYRPINHRQIELRGQLTRVSSYAPQAFGAPEGCITESYPSTSPERCVQLSSIPINTQPFKVEIYGLNPDKIYNARVAIGHLGRHIYGNSIRVTTRNSWDKLRPPFGFPATADLSSGATGAMIGENYYLLTGWMEQPGINNESQLWSLNTENFQWSQLSTFPGKGTAFGTGFYIEEQAYFGSGFEESLGLSARKSNDFWAYNPISNGWTPIDSLENDGLAGAVGFSINGTGYVGTGSESSEFWKFSPSAGRWITIAQFPGTPRTNATACVINGKGYVGFGDALSSGRQLNDWWEYDPATNQWNRRMSLDNAAGSGNRSCAFSFSIDGRGFVGGGWNENFGTLDDFYEYNPIKNTWRKKAELPICGLRNAVGFAVQGRGYVTSGETCEGFSDETWVYLPD